MYCTADLLSAALGRALDLEKWDINFELTTQLRIFRFLMQVR